MTTETRTYPALQLDWLEPGTETGLTVTPSRRGLSLEDVDKGSYGDPPDRSDTPTMRQRGAAARANSPRVLRRWEPKTEAWSASAAMLYEEASARQWSSATDIPWHTLTQLPDDLELAMCQLCTFLTQVEFIAADLPTRFMTFISPDFYEVQLFLGSQAMDESRHEDVFRKRALANGGGLMRPGRGASALLSLQDFTEMTALIHLVGEGFVQTMFRMGEMVGQNDAEKKIFRLCAQDESRHVAFGVTHLKYVLETQPERREELHAYLDRFEPAIAISQGGLTTEGDVSEAMVVLLGGGKDHYDLGYQRLLAIRKKQVNEYMHRLDVVGLPERRERMYPSLRQYLS